MLCADAFYQYQCCKPMTSKHDLACRVAWCLTLADVNQEAVHSGTCRLRLQHPEIASGNDSEKKRLTLDAVTSYQEALYLPGQSSRLESNRAERDILVSVWCTENPMLARSKSFRCATALLKLGNEPLSLADSVHFAKLQAAPFAKGPAAKAAPLKASKKAKDPGSGDSKTQKFLAALNPQETDDFELSPEERADAERRSKEYSRRKMQQHRAWQRDLTTKIKLRDAAIAALPEELRAAALMPDDELFPANRQMWTLTPPIPGFQEQQTSAMASKFSRGGRRR